MQTKQKPPIIIKPDVLPQMKGDMLEIRDMVLEHVVRIAEEQDIHIHRIVVRPDYAAEYMNESDGVIVAVYIPAEDDTAMSYWGAIGDALTESEKNLSKSAYHTLNYHFGVFVEWLPPDSFYKAIEGNEESLGLKDW